MIMCDADTDGAHITALILNMFAHFWPSLFRMPHFLSQFITPIVKARRGREILTFYTLTDFYQWRRGTRNNGRGWIIKYYKGLGTSDAQEAKEYYSEIDIHRLYFMRNDDKDDEQIKMAFASDESSARKKWLLERMSTFAEARMKNRKIGDEEGGAIVFHRCCLVKLVLTDDEEDIVIDRKAGHDIGYGHYVDHEVAQHSIVSNHRAIPALIDGLKPSQRKILHIMLKRRQTEEIKGT